MKSEIGSFYKLKSWCDAKDGLGVWRMGRVKKRIKDIIKIDFDGWSDKWKQSYCVHSSFIAPFRMHSKGYTGQPSVALREWDFNEERLKLYEGKINLLIMNDLGGFGPLEFTYFIRGDLFVLVDCLLTYTYTNPSNDAVRVTDFLSHVLDLCIKWLDRAPAVYGQANIENPDAYLYDINTSIYKGVFEVLETLAGILGLTQRTAKFFETYKTIIVNRNLSQVFVTKNGIRAVCKVLNSSVPLEDIWLFLTKFLLFWPSCPQPTRDKLWPEFISSLMRKVDQITPDTLAKLNESPNSAEAFYDNMDKVLFGKEQREGILSNLRAKLRVSVKHSAQSSIDKTVPPPKNASRTEKPAKRIKRRSENNFNVEQLRDLIEERHQHCIELLMRKVAELSSEKREKDYDLDKVFFQNTSCDRQEMAVLNALEFRLAENDIEEALKLLRWRKRILKIAAMNGWEIAGEIAKQTYQDLEIGVGHFLEVGTHKSSESLELSERSDPSLIMH